MRATNSDGASGLIAKPRADVGVRRWVRGSLLGIGLGLGLVFAFAAWIEPYDADGKPRRMATHTQLGLPACNFVVLTGKPCPACGMTTSFALLVHGDLAASLQANWVGTVLAGFWGILMLWAFASAIRGRMIGIRPGRGETLTTAAIGFFLILALARWVVILAGG